jgi:hypothetical protein
MIFDLKGRRRHVVQGTYLLLAVLMGGGLILFGIGGGTSGGLLDAFKGGGGSSGSSVVKKEIAAAQKRLALNPRDQGALTTIIRDNYSLASNSADPTTGTFTKDGKADLANAANAWERYLALNPTKPDVTLASYMFQAYSVVGLNKPAKALQAAEIVSQQQPSSNAYIRVVQYATLAKDTRTAQLAGQKAIALAPPSQRSSVKTLVKQAQQVSTSAQTGSGG